MAEARTPDQAGWPEHARSLNGHGPPGNLAGRARSGRVLPEISAATRAPPAPSRPGSSSGLVSNGNREANAGSRSDSQIAVGSNRAKNGLPTMAGSRAWIMCRANTFSPATSTTPSTHTLPGVADMDGPRTVRHSPETPA